MKTTIISINKTVGNDKQVMTSLEIAQVTGKNHKDVMRAIRNMAIAWANITGRKFTLSTYKDPTGRTLPCYSLTKTECLYIAPELADRDLVRLKALDKAYSIAFPKSTAINVNKKNLKMKE